MRKLASLSRSSLLPVVDAAAVSGAVFDYECDIYRSSYSCRLCAVHHAEVRGMLSSGVRSTAVRIRI
jgi:hypothetical protein